MKQNKKQPLQMIFRKAPTDDKCLFKLLERGRQKGFDNFINRKLIWPYLLNLQYDIIDDYPQFQWKNKMDRNSSDYQQLQKDAQRSLSSMKTFQNINKVHLKKRQQDVLVVLDNFFAKNNDLKYIQGFHDVASIFMILFGNNIGYYLMQKAGKVYFHDFLKYDVGKIGIAISSIVLDLIKTKDTDFQKIFQCFQQSKFLIFIIPWVLTWFAHVFSSVKIICRIWDYILCTGPFGAIYLTAGIILNCKEQLIAQCQEFDEANIQSFYQKKAKQQSFDIQGAIQYAIQLQDCIDIQTLPGYKQFEEKSMFKLQNFYQHINIIKKFHQHNKKQKAYRKTIQNVKTFGFIAISIGTAVLAYKFGGKYLPKNVGQL